MRTSWSCGLRKVSTRALALSIAAGLIANGFAPAAFADDAAPTAPPAAAAPTDKSAQETVFWQSVEKSNTLADYQAYLAAFPNGIFAPLAKNRIAALSAPAPAPANPEAQTSAPTPADANPPPATAPAANAAPALQPQPGPAVVAAPGPPMPPSAFGPPPQPPAPDALKAEVGTVDTENALDMGPPARMEVQLRLQAIGLYAGPIDGDLGPMARAGIAEWQKRHDLAPTGDLGPLEVDQLRIESEPQFDILLATRTAPQPVYVPVRHGYVTQSVAAPVALGILGGIAAGFLGAKFGGRGGHVDKRGGHDDKKKKIE